MYSITTVLLNDGLQTLTRKRRRRTHADDDIDRERNKNKEIGIEWWFPLIPITVAHRVEPHE